MFGFWLFTLNTIRNICAHHGRLWDRVLPIKPKIPRGNKHPQWHRPVLIRNDRIFGALTMLRHTLRFTAPTSRWPDRLAALLDNNPAIPIRLMGFPSNWQDSPLWK